jgi:molybdopterin converting factor small subunit
VADDITVTVLVFSSLQDRLGDDRCTVALPSGTVVEEIWRRLPAGIRSEVPPAGVRYAINDVWALPGTPVTGGDRIALVLPVSGG